MRQSVATISSPEFINLKPLDINPLMEACDIKVFYLGDNRNNTSISKEDAQEIAKTLRGAPIVGYYREDKGDFADHGDRVIIEGGEIKFESLTQPYGFVAPDAKVWFQEFEDTDEDGNTTLRTYLMTTGYLWTGQYEEAKQVFNGEGHQSMEFDKETLNGHWAKRGNFQKDVFIINDAIFSKLCVLGDDVEPCFEGASVTRPDISTTFSKVDDNFKHTLYSMMQELKYALQQEGGNNQMQDLEKFEKSQDNVEQVAKVENEISTEDVSTEFVKKDEEKKEEESKEEKDSKDDSAKSKEEKDSKDDSAKSKDNNNDEKASEDKEDEKKKDKYTLDLENALEESKTAYAALEQKIADLQEKYALLEQYKEDVESAKKDELIDSFYMLSYEDKKDVIENKEKYSLDDIESKLSVICVRKKVSFDLEEKVEEKEAATTYSLEDSEESVPAWIDALRNTQKSR